MPDLPHVLMLGWEYPPLINGGLGVACHGLAEALAPLTRLRLVVPHASEKGANCAFTLQGLNQLQPDFVDREVLFSSENKVFLNRISASLDPYEDAPKPSRKTAPSPHSPEKNNSLQYSPLKENAHDDWTELYAGDLFSRVDRYAEIVTPLGLGQHFDLIHAHDWMTIPAALELRKLTGKPLVLHIHSTQYDRQGSGDRGGIFEIERRGMQEADQVIAVSQYTAEVIQKNYGISSNKIRIVHNGIKQSRNLPHLIKPLSAPNTPKTVLFLGRLTAQKGPEIFLDLAERTLASHPSTTFLIAGQGDKERHLRAAIAYRGLQERVQLVGFLDEVAKEAAFRKSDVLVLPSVSEPFGLSALEAAQHGLPVILSNQSGVREVLTHAPSADHFHLAALTKHLKSLLSDPAYYQDQAQKAQQDSRNATWENAAEKLLHTYQSLLHI